MEHFSTAIIRLFVSFLLFLFAWKIYRDSVRRQGRRFWWQRKPPKLPKEKDEYEALGSLIGGYFNQDWEILYKTEDPDEVVRVFKEENGQEYAKQTAWEIWQFLALYGENDDQLTQSLERTFRPEFAFYNLKGRTTREGLEKVIEILSSPPKTA